MEERCAKLKCKGQYDASNVVIGHRGGSEQRILESIITSSEFLLKPSVQLSKLHDPCFAVYLSVNARSAQNHMCR